MVVQTGQRPQKSGSGLVHFAHNGASQVPLRAWATVPQPLQARLMQFPRVTVSLAGGHGQVLEVDLGGEQAAGPGGHLDRESPPQPKRVAEAEARGHR
ncbi:hypothetical protein [Streptomyces sp. NPDC048473]|uniref:hypothetical protein n=1 Tax=unclassified Streptomyces TaxID=2593676 RepID=UPI0037140E39